MPRDDAETTDVLAALDLLPRTALVRAAGSTTVDEVNAAFLSRLFVPSAKRGRGFGRLILAKLRELYETMPAGRLAVVYGFALVGEGVCASAELGQTDALVRAHTEWTERTGVVWRPEDGPEAEPGLVAEPVSLEELEDVCTVDAELLRRDLESKPVSHRLRFAITADAACLRMRIAGAQFTQTRVKGQSITRIGARIGRESYILWTVRSY